MTVEWKVGQKVYYVPTRGMPHHEVIQRVGRRWAYFGKQARFDMSTGRALEGDYFCGEVWPSKADHDAYAARVNAWHALGRWFRNISLPPSHLTTEQIKRIHAEIAGETE